MDLKELDVTKRKLFIGGLHSTITDDSLQEFFEQWGEIEDAVVIKDPITNISRGFGFITYLQSCMADQAMSNKPHFINGLEVNTKLAVFHDNIHKIKMIALNKIYMTGIKEHSKQDLYDYFKKYGNIIHIKIVTDHDSGIRKGYAFIEYEDRNSVGKAVLLKTHYVAGEKLIVNKAFSRAGISDESQGGHGDLDGGSGGINGSDWKRNPQEQQFRGNYRVFKTQHYTGQKLFANKVYSPPGDADGSRGGRDYLDGGSGGIIRSNFGRNLQDQQCGGIYNGSNGAVAGYVQFGKGEGNSCVGVVDGYGGRAGVHNSYDGGAWQGASQLFVHTMDPNENRGPIQTYYNSDVHAVIYGQSEALYVNEGQQY